MVLEFVFINLSDQPKVSLFSAGMVNGFLQTGQNLVPGNSTISIPEVLNLQIGQYDWLKGDGMCIFQRAKFTKGLRENKKIPPSSHDKCHAIRAGFLSAVPP